MDPCPPPGTEDVYGFELVPSSDGTVTVDVADGVATNGLGNTNTEAPQLELFSDRTVPVPVITTTPAEHHRLGHRRL